MVKQDSDFYIDFQDFLEDFFSYLLWSTQEDKVLEI